MDWAEASASSTLSPTGPIEIATRRLLRRVAAALPVRTPPFWRGEAIAVACVLAGTGLRAALEPVAHNHIPVVLFYPFVLVASIWGGVWSGVTAMVAGAAIARLFWLPPSGNEVTLITFSVVCLFGVFMARLFRELVEIHAEGESRARLLTHEINHRANNLLGVVQAISDQTARGAPTVEAYRLAFEARLTALARAQHMIARDPDASVDLGAFLRDVIEPFGGDRFILEGPPASVPHHLAPPCALLVHELCTNATKHGSLSSREGRVEIGWRIGQDRRARLEWRELGGPGVRPPTRAGFGSRLIGMAFPPDRGRVRVSYEPDGVRCIVEFLV